MARTLPSTSDAEPSALPAVEADAWLESDVGFEGSEARHARALQRRLHDAFVPDFDYKPSGMTLRARAVTIFGVSCVLWAMIGFVTLAAV